MDDETGLYYLNARYYDSAIARFITEDSYTGERFDPLSLNLYTYCGNNPIVYTDPSGHKSTNIDYGDKGNDVAAIQRTLKAKGYYTGKVDGDFGAGTLAAVKAYQKANKLKADGVVGDETYGTLYGSAVTKTKSALELSGSASYAPKTPVVNVKVSSIFTDIGDPKT